MKPASLPLAALLFGLAFGPVGCHKPEEGPEILPEKHYSAPLPPGEVALRRIEDPARIPDFSRAYGMQVGLDRAAKHSLAYLAKPSTHQFFPYDPAGEITHARAVASVKLFRRTLAEARSPEHLNELIRERFEVWESVGCDSEGTVLFTGYYCPIFEARLEPDSRFRFPLYRMPDDLIKDELGNCLGRRLPNGGVAPRYYSRREIVEGPPPSLRGKELCYLSDPFEAYIVTVQGSAKLRLADGRLFEIGYVANNGHEYKSIARRMVEDGKIPEDKLSLASMIEFFNEFPGEIAYYTNQNPRYVFFQEQSGGPYGSLNVPVTPYRSIATDKEVYPRACVAFLQTRLPGFERGRIVEHDYHAFALDQDTGGAIRAPGRCDVYLGVGDEVGELAGRTMSEGRLYYVFAKPGAARR